MFYYKVNDELSLRLLEYRHAQPLFDLIQANKEYLGQWLPFIKWTNSVTDTHQFIESGLKQFYENNGLQAGLWYHDTLVGVIGLHYIEWHARKTSIGYWLAKQYQGQGHMTKACKVLVDHLFRDRGLNRIEIRIPQGNQKSQAIPERLGFKMEGVIRDGEKLDKNYLDLSVFGLLRKDWEGE